MNNFQILFDMTNISRYTVTTSDSMQQEIWYTCNSVSFATADFYPQ